MMLPLLLWYAEECCVRIAASLGPAGHLLRQRVFRQTVLEEPLRQNCGGMRVGPGLGSTAWWNDDGTWWKGEFLYRICIIEVIMTVTRRNNETMARHTRHTRLHVLFYVCSSANPCHNHTCEVFLVFHSMKSNHHKSHRYVRLSIFYYISMSRVLISVAVRSSASTSPEQPTKTPMSTSSTMR